MADRVVTITRNSVGIQGPRGIDGADGAPGAPGADGIGLELKGWVATVGDLPTDAVAGDTYMVQADGLGYVRGETEWSAGISLQGPQGDPGTDGREVEVQKSLTHVQWRYVGDATWTDLIALADITGPQGATGTTGSAGADGREIELQKTDTYVQWRYTGGSWTNLVALIDLIGPQGATGATGATGAKGDTGDPGPNTISSSTTVTGLSGVLKVSAGYAAGGATYSDVGAAAASHTHAASDITSGTIATARLGSGTADNTTYLRGDQTWGTVSGGSATQAFGTVSVSGQPDVVADAAPDTLTLVAGSNITITTNASADSITIAASGGGTTNLSVTNKTSTSLDVASDTGTDATIPAASGTEAGLMTAAQYTKLSGIEASASAAGATGDAFASSHPGGNQHIDWTADQGATNIHSGNIPDLSATYAAAAKGVTNGDSHDHSGGDGAQISYAGLSNIPSSFTPASHDHASNKLSQGNTHESADTDSATTSLHHTIGTGANQAAAGNHAHSGTYEPVQTAASQAEAEAGSVTSIRSFTPQRIFQAIAAKVAAMFGTTAGTVCQGNDSRLSDARTPTSHDHSGNKLAQANTHESADTNSATTSLHHTIGTGANNAAAGNHTHIEYRASSAYHCGATNSTAITTGAATADQITAYPFIIKSDFTITELRAGVSTAGAAGTKFRIALYSDSGSLTPGNIISGTDVSEGDAASATYQTFTLASAITLTPGLYWAAFNTNGAPTMRAMPAAVIYPVLGLTSGNAQRLAVYKAYTYGEMPSSFPTGLSYVSSTPPTTVWMKAQ